MKRGGFKPTRYSVHVMDPGASHSNSKTVTPAASTSNSITKGQSIMVHVAKRNSNRCPTHPGALLREDVIPPTGRIKAKIAQLLGISRQHLYDILRRCLPPWRLDLANCLATAPIHFYVRTFQMQQQRSAWSYAIRSSGSLRTSAIFFKAVVVPFRRPLSRSEM